MPKTKSKSQNKHNTPVKAAKTTATDKNKVNKEKDVTSSSNVVDEISGFDTSLRPIPTMASLGDSYKKRNSRKHYKINKKYKKKKGLSINFSTDKSKVLNEIIKKAKLSEILVKAFDLWYKDQSYFLQLNPLDNDIVLENYIMKPIAFLDLLKSFQKQYNIYSYGYNVFQDGNIMYVINKSTPNKLMTDREWVYRFTVISDKTPVFDRPPLGMNKSSGFIDVGVRYDQVKWCGHFVDTTYKDNLRIKTDEGKLIDSKKATTTAYKGVTLDNHTGKGGKGSGGGGGLLGGLGGGALGGLGGGALGGLGKGISNIGNQVQGTVNQVQGKLNEVKEQAKGTLKQVEDKVGNIPGGKQLLSKAKGIVGGIMGTGESKSPEYDIIMITLDNSFITFVPGDKIEIKFMDKPSYQWTGTIKRWASQQTFTGRAVFIIAVGAQDGRNALTGNNDIKGILGGLFGNGIPSLDDISGALSKIQDFSDNVFDKLRGGYDNIKMLAEEQKNHLFAFADRTVDRLAGKLYDKGMEKIFGALDTPEKKAMFNKIYNYGEAIWNSPTIGPYIQQGISKLGSMFDMTINDMIDSVSSIGDSSESNYVITEENTTNVDVVKPNVPALPIIPKENKTDNTIDKAIEELRTKWHFDGDGIDEVLHTRLNNDIIEHKGFYKQFIEQYHFTNEDFENIKFILLLVLKDKDHSIKRFLSYPNFDHMIDYIRGYYKERLPKDQSDVKVIPYTPPEDLLQSADMDEDFVNTLLDVYEETFIKYGVIELPNEDKKEPYKNPDKKETKPVKPVKPGGDK